MCERNRNDVKTEFVNRQIIPDCIQSPARPKFKLIINNSFTDQSFLMNHIDCPSRKRQVILYKF